MVLLVDLYPRLIEEYSVDGLSFKKQNHYTSKKLYTKSFALDIRHILKKNKIENKILFFLEDEFERILNCKKVNNDFFYIDISDNLYKEFIFYDNNRNEIKFNQESRKIKQSEIDNLINFYYSLISKVDIIVVSDTLDISYMDIINKLIKIARVEDKKIILKIDNHNSLKRLEETPDYLIVSENVLLKNSLIIPVSLDEYIYVINELKSKGFHKIIVDLAQKGIIYIEDSNIKKMEADLPWLGGVSLDAIVASILILYGKDLKEDHFLKLLASYRYSYSSYELESIRKKDILELVNKFKIVKL